MATSSCEMVRGFALHRKYDIRCQDYRRQWNQFMESEIITAQEHAVVRPLMVHMASVVSDALEADADCQSPAEIHRAYDLRTQGLLDQENELAENGQITVKTHGLARNILMGLENVVRDALVSRFGQGD